MKILTLEHLLEIHAIVIKVTGGGSGLRDLRRLEAVIASQTQNVFGEELYPAMLDKAAAIIREIIADHPFVDGNKRTAMLAGLVFLDINNLTFIAEKKELEDFAVEVAVSKHDVTQIAQWLSEHLKK